MKKIWSYIAVFFAGVSVMAIAALKWFAGDDYKVYIDKIKQRGKGNRLDSKLDVDLTPKNESGGVLANRKIKRIERKKKRSLKRLEKLS